MLIAKVYFADVGSDTYNYLAQSRLLGRIGCMYLEGYNDKRWRNFCTRLAHVIPKWIRPA